MAKWEHVEMLARSIHEWNEYRQQHPDEEMEITGAILPEIDSEGRSIKQANFEGVDMTRVRFVPKEILERPRGTETKG